MGVPFGKLTCASNDNKVVYDFFQTGTYDKNGEFILTTSPSMDILVSSKLERLPYLSCEMCRRDRFGAYKESAQILAHEILEAEWEPKKEAHLLVLHASNHRTSNTPVSYTHLDVYKRQLLLS